VRIGLQTWGTEGDIRPFFALAQALKELAQVCSARSEAHRKGLVHRDIKLSNIFVCERGGAYDVIKLLDFGLVYIEEPAPSAFAAAPPSAPTGTAELRALTTAPGPPANLTQAGQLLGSPAYMAPEQIQGKQPDPRSDIYSLSAVAWFLLTGRPPFERETLAELYAAHITTPVPCLRDQGLRGPVRAVLRKTGPHVLTASSTSRPRSGLVNPTNPAPWSVPPGPRGAARRQHARGTGHRKTRGRGRCGLRLRALLAGGLLASHPVELPLRALQLQPRFAEQGVVLVALGLLSGRRQARLEPVHRLLHDF
jgi:serine/threonine protein kinase